MGFTRRDRKDLAVLGLWVWALLAFGPVLHQAVPHGHEHGAVAAGGHAHRHAHFHGDDHAHEHSGPGEGTREGEGTHAHGAFDPTHGGAHWLEAHAPQPPVTRWLNLGLTAVAAPASPVLARRWTPVLSQAP